MKKLLFVGVLLLMMTLMPHTAFAADVQWVRIVEDNVCLFATAESSKVLFVLEKSYYLRVVEDAGEMYLVSVMENQQDFPQILGYVWKSEVEVCDETPVAPFYPTEKLTVDADSAQVKLSPTPNADTVITVTNSQKVSYFGSVTSYGEEWFYVYFHGKFGYVLSQSVTQPAIALHPTPLVEEVVTLPQPTPEDQQQTEAEQPASSTSEIVLIVFVALLAVGICVALFLPHSKKDVFDKDI